MHRLTFLVLTLMVLFVFAEVGAGGASAGPPSALMAQQHDSTSKVEGDPAAGAPPTPTQPPHVHHAPPVAGQWDGSPEGKAYSEFNHHLAGVFVLLIGLSELRGALGVTMLAWSRFLLPLAMLGAGGFLMIWSDHEAWPIGYKSFAETYFSDDWETVQHKLYAILLLSVGTIEFLRRSDKIKHMAWGIPLPLFALIGGVMLFLHSHGAHPSAHKIAMHHAVMGTTAILAAICKVTAGYQSPGAERPSAWGLAWSALVLAIGVELLIYTE